MFFLRLQARNPGANVYRDYRVTVEHDLLGDLVVETRHGRIGAPHGGARRLIAADEQEAVRLIRQILRRRGTALQRIGVAYVVVEASEAEVVGMTAEELVAVI